MGVKKTSSKQHLVSFLAMFCVFVIFFGTTTPANAYNLLKYRWPSKSIAYQWGYCCKNDSEAKSTWETAVNDWRNACSMNFYYTTNTLNVLEIMYEESSAEYGKTRYDGGYDGPGLFSYFQSYLNMGLDELRVSKFRRSVANHELGHALGLDEDNRPLLNAIMNQTRKRILIYIPQDDDIQGVNAIYG